MGGNLTPMIHVPDVRATAAWYAGAARREVDLYLHTNDVTTLAERLRTRTEVVEDVHETEYAMREFIIRDLNGFWLTFGEPITQP